MKNEGMSRDFSHESQQLQLPNVADTKCGESAHIWLMWNYGCCGNDKKQDGETSTKETENSSGT